jgi:hypothetical protein
MATSRASLFQVGLHLPRRTVQHRDTRHNAPFGGLALDVWKLYPKHEVYRPLDDFDIDPAGKQDGHHAPLSKRRVSCPIWARPQ